MAKAKRKTAATSKKRAASSTPKTEKLTKATSKKRVSKKAASTASKKTAKLTKDAIASIDKNLGGGTKPKKDAKPKKGATAPRVKSKMSGLDAAAQILAKATEPMDCRHIVVKAKGQGLWAPAGKTPHATLYAAIIREISKKGSASRFKKSSRGHFELRKKAA